MRSAVSVVNYCIANIQNSFVFFLGEVCLHDVYVQSEKSHHFEQVPVFFVLEVEVLVEGVLRGDCVVLVEEVADAFEELGEDSVADVEGEGEDLAGARRVGVHFFNN